VTRICLMSRAVEIWFWLCPTHIAERQKEGWELRSSKEPPHPLNCDLCPREDAA